MKRLLKICFFLTLVFSNLFCFNSLKAGHMIGGDISWECLPSGEFVFSMTLYRDCQGISATYQNQTLTISGNPLPRENGISVNQIILKPDTNRWNSQNNGVINPRCDSAGPAFSCQNGDNGSIQKFYYKSDPLRLNGIPPSSGWKFSYVEPCCRLQVENISQGGAIELRAIMYRLSPTSNPVICYDNSPKFIAQPEYAVCRGNEISLNNAVSDKDLDSLVYSFGNPNNILMGSNSPVSYSQGFSYSNPTPDQTFDTNNVALSIDGRTGSIRGKVSSGSGIQKYWVSYKVDAYRNGVKLSTNYREHPIYVFDCMPLDSNRTNSRPEIYIGNQLISKDTTLDYYVGDSVFLPIQVIDSDTLAGGAKQEVILQVNGTMLSSSLYINDSTVCVSPPLRPCAIFKNSGFVFNTIKLQTELNGNGALATNMLWDLNCNLLKSGNAPRTLYFYFKAQDDNCPIPMVNYQTIGINLLPNSANPCVLSTEIEEEKSGKEEFEVYPNPTNGKVYINLGEEKEVQLQIRDLSGKLISQKWYSGQKQLSFNIDKPSGVYFVELVTSSGFSFHRKVVKQ